MEKYLLFGFPSPIIGFVCFLIAGLFMLIWPKSKARVLNTLNFQKFVLHYFHPLAWVLMGMAAFMKVGSPSLATMLAGLGALAFGMFIYIFVRS